MHHIHGRAAELERELLLMRGQFERDQLMLQQYDGRVQALETEMATVAGNAHAQMAGHNEILNQLQEQSQMWRSKYEALAKLYTQLRNEHLDLLTKYKQIQLKAGSAGEAIQRVERMEREMKAKNLELSDMIRERDRARLTVDRLKGGENDEIERLKRELRFANERAEDSAHSRGTEVSSIMSRMTAQVNELEAALREHKDTIDSKDAEIQILQEGMDSTIREFNDLRINNNDSTAAVDAQIDTLILDNAKQLSAIIDSIFQSCADKIDCLLYTSPSPRD